MRALSRILDSHITAALVTLNSLQNHPIAGPAACALIVHAHSVAPQAVPHALEAQDTLDALGTQHNMLPAASLHLAQVHWLTGAFESSRVLLDRLASAGDATAKRMLAWVILSHAQQHLMEISMSSSQQQNTAAYVLLGFDDDDHDFDDDDHHTNQHRHHPAQQLAAEAHALFDQCLASQPTNSIALLGMTLAHVMCGQHDAANSTHQQLMQHCPAQWVPAVEASVVLSIHRGNWEAVARVLHGVLQGQEEGKEGEEVSIGLLMHAGVCRGGD